jgi:hypothetical protein
MNTHSQIKAVFHQLAQGDIAQIELGGSNITIRVLDRDSTFSLTTPVYFGGNFIPKSVRHCLSQKAPFAKEGLKTQLSIDENNFKIFLNYLGSLDHLNGEKFKNLLEEFCWLADEWRFYLDEHDKNDLVHVRQK